jgi:prevent-host-death family protein
MYNPDVDLVSAFDAKTHLSQLLTKVQQGSRITITKHNTPVAMLVPIQSGKNSVEDVVESLLALRKRNTLDGLSVKELRQEGRR